MGAELSRPGGGVAARLYALVDRLYRRWHRLERVGGILWVGRRRWRGAGRRLEDGTTVEPGDAILWLHLDGGLAAADAAGASSPAAAGRRFARRFLPACQELARRLGEEPAWREVVALHAVGWISPYVGEPWGFEFERLPDGLRTRLIRWHIGRLLGAAGAAHDRRPRPWPMAVWISRRRLCERFAERPGPA